MKRLACAIVVSMVSAMAACAGPQSGTKAAAGDDPWAGRNDLIPAPTPVAPIKPLDLGQLELFKLDNGLQVVLVPRHELPLVSARLAIRAGSYNVPGNQVGLADFTASMLRKGAGGLSADDISQRIDSVGGLLWAGAGLESSYLGCSALADHSERCLELVAKQVLEPAFPKEEMAEIANQMQAYIQRRRDNPDLLAGEHIMNRLFTDEHPHGRVLTAETIAAIDRAALVAFHGKHYRPNNAILAVAGDFDAKAMGKSLRAHFGHWEKGEVQSSSLAQVSAPKGMKVLVVDKPGLNQSQIRLAHPGVAHGNPERRAVELMNYTLGAGSFSSRLMMVVRAKGAKTYRVRSRFEDLDNRGAFTITTFTRTPETLSTIQEVLRVVREFAATGPTDDELLHAKGHKSGAYLSILKDSGALAETVVDALLHGDTLDDIRDHQVRLWSITREEAEAAASKYLHPNDIQVVIVGDGDGVAKLLTTAEIPFERISFNEPISAAARQKAAAERNDRSAAAKDPTNLKLVESLIGAALDAHGGAKRIRNVKNFRKRSEINMEAQGQPVTIGITTQAIRPTHYRVEVQGAGMNQLVVITPEKSFMQVGPNAVPLEGERLRQAREGIDFAPIADLLRAYDDKSMIVAQSNVEADDQRYDVLDVLQEGKSGTRYFLDADHLVTRVITSQGQVDYRGYSEHDGIQVPSAARLTAQGTEQDIQVKSLQLNVGVEKGLFKQ